MGPQWSSEDTVTPRRQMTRSAQRRRPVRSKSSPGATVPPTVASFGAAGYNQPNSAVAVAAPANCATIKPGASTGRMPAKVLLAARASVTAGLAKEVDDVNQ